MNKSVSNPAVETLEYQPSRAPSAESANDQKPMSGQPGRAAAFLPAGPVAPQQLEIQVLLRQRLRVLVLLAGGTAGLYWVLRLFRLEFTPEVLWRTMAPAGVFILTMTVLGAFIWRPRVQPLGQLRVFESVLFGIVALFFAWETYGRLFLPPGWFLEYTLRHASEMAVLARHPSIKWFALTIAYGTFIPNTGRRCAVVTSLIALTPLTIVAVGGLTTEGIAPRPLMIFLVEMFMWMAVAVAFAIYGSHKISVLRQQAWEARKLGQYQLKKRLGAGGMGEVYLAEHLLLRRPCAVKLIRPDRAGDPEALARFLREVQATATLTHPNTVQVFDYGQAADGTLYYCMEYLPGLSLHELVTRHGPLPAGRAVALLRQLCGALVEAHAIGLIHRDIKPSNVIVCRRGAMHDVAKLLDFGLVRVQTTDGDGAPLTQAGLIFGTPNYMSPEQAAGRADVDARSDIYSLGALAYFLLTGKPPFVRESAVQTMAAQISEPVVPMAQVRGDMPGDVAAIVLRCLAKSPAERYQSAVSLDQALSESVGAQEWTQSQAADWWEAQAVSAEARVN